MFSPSSVLPGLILWEMRHDQIPEAPGERVGSF
jgi:hypothetical protein